MDSSNKAESVFHEQISRSEEKEQMAGQGQLGAADAVRPDAARVYAVSLRTTGENLELLTAGEAEQLAARMEVIRDRALQKIAEAFAHRSAAYKQERSASALALRQPCRKGNLER